MCDNTLFNRSSIKTCPGLCRVVKCDVINFDYLLHSKRDRDRERDGKSVGGRVLWYKSHSNVCERKLHQTKITSHSTELSPHHQMWRLPVWTSHSILYVFFFCSCNANSPTTVPIPNVKWKCETNRRHVCWCKGWDKRVENKHSYVDCVYR